MSALLDPTDARAHTAIRHARHQCFAAAGPYVRDERRLRHYRDLLAPYGVPLDERMLQLGGQNGFHAMAGALVARLELPAALDLVVIAHATPDFDPILSTASHLAHLCPGEPRSFAVSDQGIGTPFAALEVIAAHLRRPGYAHALLVVLEQTTLPNYDGRVHAAPVHDSAVAILLGTGGGDSVAAVRRQTVVEADEAAALLADLARRAPRTLVLAGPALDIARNLDVPVHVASARHLCTAVWVALSEHLDLWRARFSRLLVADYDPWLGHLHIAAIVLAAPQEER